MVKRQDAFFIIFLLFFGIVGIAFNNSATFFVALIIFFAGFIYFLRDMDQNVFLLAFLISFFTFLMGSEAIILLGIRDYKYDFPKAINYHAYSAIVVALVSLFLSYILTSVFQRRYNNELQNTEELPPMVLSLRKVSRIVFYLLIIFKIIVNLSEVVFSRTFGYSGLYTDYYFQGPAIFIKLADMCTTAFFAFLGTLPTKKECRVPVSLYLFINFISIFAGRRNDLIVALLIVFAYYCFRNIMYSYDEVWVAKKQVIVLILLSPLLLSALYMVSSLRSGDKGNLAFSYFNGVLDFFYQQGFSINIIKWEKSLEGSIPDRLYSLGQIYEFFTTNNFLSRLLFDFRSFSGQTAERALEGHRLSYLLAYLVFPWSYSQGYGVGSCYIAEAYHDFGYVGIAVFNAVYGFLFARFNYVKYRGPILMTISFIMIQALLLAPRLYADAFIGNVLDFSNIEILLLIWIIARYLYKRSSSAAMLDLESE